MPKSCCGAGKAAIQPDLILPSSPNPKVGLLVKTNHPNCEASPSMQSVQRMKKSRYTIRTTTYGGQQLLYRRNDFFTPKEAG